MYFASTLANCSSLITDKHVSLAAVVLQRWVSSSERCFRSISATQAGVWECIFQLKCCCDTYCPLVHDLHVSSVDVSAAHGAQASPQHVCAEHNDLAQTLTGQQEPPEQHLAPRSQFHRPTNGSTILHRDTKREKQQNRRLRSALF